MTNISETDAYIFPNPYHPAVTTYIDQGYSYRHAWLLWLAYLPPNIYCKVWENLGPWSQRELRMVRAMEDVEPYEIEVDFGEWGVRWVDGGNGRQSEDGLKVKRRRTVVY